MGLKEFFKKLSPVSKINDIADALVIEWTDTDAEAKRAVVYKYEGDKLSKYHYVIVRSTQEALVFKNGEYIHTFPAGRYPLKEGASALLNNDLDQCEVFFVNKVKLQQVAFGTDEAIPIRDQNYYNETGRVQARGRIAMHIENAYQFFNTMVGYNRVERYYSQETLEDDMAAKIVEFLTDNLGNTVRAKGISLLDLSTCFKMLSKTMQDELTPYFEDYGIALDNFSFMHIGLRDDDYKKFEQLQHKRTVEMMEADTAMYTTTVGAEAAKIASMKDTEAQKYRQEGLGYSYQQSRAFDVMGAAASNESAGMAPFMGAGMGIGMGVGMGGAFGGAMAGAANTAFNSAAQQAQAPQTPCPSCGAPVAAGAKFCGSCGAKMVTAPVCPACGAEVAPGAKFCGSCGTALVAAPTVCPSCGAQLAPGAKFCGECGAKI